MDKETVKRILNIQEKIQTDVDLMTEYRSAQAAFLAMLPELTEMQKDILMDYLGVCVEIHLRMLELSCKTEE